MAPQPCCSECWVCFCFVCNSDNLGTSKQSLGPKFDTFTFRMYSSCMYTQNFFSDLNRIVKGQKPCQSIFFVVMSHWGDFSSLHVMETEQEVKVNFHKLRGVPYLNSCSHKKCPYWQICPSILGADLGLSIIFIFFCFFYNSQKDI